MSTTALTMASEAAVDGEDALAGADLGGRLIFELSRRDLPPDDDVTVENLARGEGKEENGIN